MAVELGGRRVMVGANVNKNATKYRGLEKNRFKYGEKVIVFGIRSKRQWNRKNATIVGEYQQHSGRWPIKVHIDENNNETGLVKPTNLIGLELKWKIFKCMDPAMKYLVAKGALNVDKSRCAWCLKGKELNIILQKCKKCNDKHVKNSYIPRYCSKQCQKRHWIEHKKTCGTL